MLFFARSAPRSSILRSSNPPAPRVAITPLATHAVVVLFRRSRTHSKESGNRLQDITDRLPQDEANALSDRGWSLYVMNMVLAPGNQLIFRKNNEREFQPYFGSTVKSQLRSSTLPEMTPDAFEALCRRLHAPDLAERISRLPDLTVRPVLHSDLCNFRHFQADGV